MNNLIPLLCQAPENNPVERHDLNESTLDLSLGLKAHEGENKYDPKADQVKDNQLEWVSSIIVGRDSSCEAGNKPEEIKGVRGALNPPNELCLFFGLLLGY